MSQSSGRKVPVSSQAQSPGYSAAAPVAGGKPAWMNMVAIGILLIAYFIAYNTVYDDKINLGGDSLMYYYLGKALATGHGFSDIMSPVQQPHNHFPPGYPFIISLFMRVGFSGIPFFCGLNGFFGAVVLVLMYLFTSRVTGDKRVGFVTAFFLALNPAFLSSAIVTMSEVPSALFITVAFYLMATSKREPVPFYRDLRFWLLLVCVVVGYYVRSSAISLLPAVICFYLFRKQWVHAGGIAIGFIAAIYPWIVRTGKLGGSSYLKQFVMKNPYRPEMGNAETGDFITRIQENLERYISFEIPSSFLSDLFPESAEGPGKYWIGGLIILGLIIYGMVLLAKRMPAMIVYMLCAGGVLLIWPQVWGGPRFMVTLLPFLLLTAIFAASYLIAKGLKKMSLPWNPLVLSVPGVFFVTGALGKLRDIAEEPFAPQYQNYFNIAEWAKTHLPENAVIACRKPELLYYYADRRCVSYLKDSNANNLLADLKAHQVTHVIVDQLGFSSTPLYLIPAIQKNESQFRLIYQTPAPENFLLQFQPK